MKTQQITTSNLLLRQWQDSDYDAFARLNADANNMRFFPAPLAREESDHLANRCRDLINQRGWGFWAVEEVLSGQFIGCVGLHAPDYQLPVSPCVEVGWRLLPEFQGKGYATEAAQAALGFGFNELHLDEIIAFTTLTNLPSQAVMRRLGMQRDFNNDFDHPLLDPQHPLVRHCLYRLSQQDWFNLKNS
ncbi:GNAT family N-acetyltransferase [Pseudomonas sp. F1_0610]|uniref:GNAT family N-acetyltransferase n=1 Tax=Pseudomonas sp. F1_0610 TaxID=3114284 RepID=UPI0039C01260